MEFEAHTRPLANLDVPATELQTKPELYAAWTLHQLRHAALTHETEDGADTPPCSSAPGKEGP